MALGTTVRQPAFATCYCAQQLRLRVWSQPRLRKLMTMKATYLHRKLAVGVYLLRRALAQILHVRQAAQELILCLLRLCRTAGTGGTTQDFRCVGPHQLAEACVSA